MALIAAHPSQQLTRSYATNLAHRLPLLYCVVLFDIVVLAASFRPFAPPLLTLAVPAALLCGIAWRATHWLPRFVNRRSEAQLTGDLARLQSIGTLTALACTAWALALYPYGDTARQSLVHYITAITCFTGILGLAQSPGTAIRMTVVTMAPTTAWFAYHGHPNWLAICSVQLVVSALLLLIVIGYHADFVSLELSRHKLDVKERESARFADAMERQASRDALTDVASRSAILARIEAMLADCSLPPPWLALIDLDGFKHVNDTFGHAAGDIVLRTVCDRIGEVAEVEACGRLGGDEFALLVAGSRTASDVRNLLVRLMLRIAEPIPHESYALAVTASIGLRRTERTSVSDCLERADEALYRAKRQPGGAVVEFGADDERAMRERAAVTRVFSSADLSSRIDVAYQPIVDLDAATTYSFEALARWNTGDGDALTPDVFIPLAESTGRISELTQLVLERALRELPAWTMGTRLSVNLSARDILQENAAQWLGGIVAAGGAPPASIIFEITETALIADLRRAASNLEALRAQGFHIALDDFGTGQSSLSHVHRLPLDHIKLDRSFANELETSRSGRAVAATVLALARQLDLSCSIEGIETAAQAAAARSLGFRLMQGYYFGRPGQACSAMDAHSKAA